MRAPDDPGDAAQMVDIYDDPGRAADAVSAALYLDGDRFRVTALTAASVADAPAVALEATLPTMPSLKLIRREAKVRLRIEGIVWEDYVGTVMKLGQNDDGSCALTASTPGYWQGGDDGIKFNATTAYSHRPHNAMEDMLKRFPYKRLIIPAISGPLYVRQGPLAWPPVALVGEAIDDLELKAGVVQRDNWLSEAYTRTVPSLGTIVTGSPIHWRKGEHVSAFEHELKEGGQFYDVGVVRQNRVTGEYEQLVKPRVRVRYDPGVAPPPQDATYYEEITEGEDAEQEVVDAREKAVQLAATFSFGGPRDCTFLTPFLDPRVEDYDVRDVTVVDYETQIVTRHRVMIEAQSRDYLGMGVSYTGTGAIMDMVQQPPSRRPEWITPAERIAADGKRRFLSEEERIARRGAL